MRGTSRGIASENATLSGASVESLRKRIAHHERIIELLQDVLSPVAIAQARRVRRVKGPRGVCTKYDWHLGLKLWNKGLPVMEIAKLIGCRCNKVYAAAERDGWRKRKRRVRR